MTAPPTPSPPRGGPRRAAWDSAFFERRRRTSKLKHFVLEPYFREFAYHLGSACPVIYYVDGFAGAGAYARGDGGVDLGSPVLIAKFADGLLTTASFQVRCLNVEANRKRYKDLQAATALYRSVEKNYRQPFVHALPDIIKRVGDAPAFFFIDPFGTKDIPFAELRPIFSRTTRTEALITFHTDGIAKKAGYFQWLSDGDPKVRKQALAMTTNCALALDVSVETLHAWWSECVQDNRGGGTAAFEQRVLTHYLARLRTSDTRFRYVKAFPVPYIDGEAPPNEQTPVCFYLVFGTQHHKGLEVMNAQMVRAVERFRKEEYRDSLWPMLLPDLERGQQLTQLEREILARFRSRTFTVDVMKHQLMQETTLLLSDGDYTRTLRRLVKAAKFRDLGGGRFAGPGAVL